MARGRMLREKHISAVKQSSSSMGFFSKPCLPQPARFSYPASPTASHKWLPHLLAKKNSPNWNSLISDNRASGGPAVSSFIYGLYAFIVTATRLEGSIESLSWSIHLFWNRWRCRESHPAKNVICLFCSGIVWQMEAATRTISAKVTERCRVLSRGRPGLLLHVNLNPSFHSPYCTGRSCSLCNSFSPCLNV